MDSTGRPLDILVNNAAIATSDATVEKATPEQFDREFADQCPGAILHHPRALPLLRDGGRIINISSGRHMVRDASDRVLDDQGRA